MAEEELLNELENRERETVAITLSAAASKSAVTIDEFIQLRLAQGASPESIKNLLINDLRNNGRIFGEFRRSIKSTASGSINRVRDSAMYSEFGVDRKYRWVAVLVNTCPDCLNNHGVVMAWDDWEVSEFGLPRTGGTVCRQNCKCVLLVEEATEVEPLKRRVRKKS